MLRFVGFSSIADIRNNVRALGYVIGAGLKVALGPVGVRADVRDHIGRIFANWPDLRFSGRRLYARDGLVVSEWTATATNRAGQRVEWDGIDVFPFENGLIVRKDVYSSSHRPRVVG